MKKGFTLVEIMVVLAIFTIIIGASYALMNSGRMSWYSGDAKISIQQDLRQAMDYISYEISESAPGHITIAAGGDSITLQVPVDENASGTWEDIDANGTNDLFLEKTLSALGDIAWGAYLRQEDVAQPSSNYSFGLRAGRSIIFYLSGTDLIRRVVSPAGQTLEDFMLARDVRSISFTSVSNEVITIAIAARKLTIDMRPAVYDLVTSVYLRNK